MKKLGIFCLLCMLALAACRKDKDDVTTTEDPYIPPVINWTPGLAMVNGSLTGFVISESGEPLSDADVKVGNMTATTDQYGHFFLKDVQLNAKGTVVTVKKAGYFNGSRRFLAVEGQENRIKIEMLKKSFDHSFDAANGGTMQTTDGASIIFPANSIKKADGSIYSGEVKVAARWLDPANYRTLDRMPGNLQGVDRTAEEVALSTYGMMAVELESPAGESLNIASGKTATLSMPVPAALQANAPSEIPLWSYHEEFGIWVEEEFKATLTNGAYVGEVTHFSFWNCDYPYPLVELTTTLVNENGDPLANYLVTITLNSFSGAGYTCPDGTITGLIPANENLVMEVLSICGDVLYTQNIGPFQDDVDLGTITVPNSGLNQTSISGELVDCNNNPIQNGVITFQFDNWETFEYVTGGSFDVSFTTCAGSSDVTVVAADLDALVQSDPLTFAANATHNAGQVSVCDVQLQDYISITVDDGTNVVTEVYFPANLYQDSLITGGLGTALSFYNNNPGAPQAYLYFSVPGMAAGDYSTNNYIEIFSDVNHQWEFGQGEIFSTFVITEFGDIGEPVIGNFSGTLTNNWAQPPTSVSVTGSFNITRQ